MTAMTRNRPLTSTELDAFGNELDGVRARTVATLGQRDADYIRRVAAAVRWIGLAGRLLLLGGAIGGAFVPVLLWPLCIAGTLLLALSKILENMELGHNVMHGQFDWMGDPQLNGQAYEWDIAGTSDNWRKTHNHQHHTWTNVRGMDDDIGYGLLRLFPEQRWKPLHLIQPAVAVVFALLFEWGVAIQDLRLGRWLAGKMRFAQLRDQFRQVGQGGDVGRSLGAAECAGGSGGTRRLSLWLHRADHLQGPAFALLRPGGPLDSPHSVGQTTRLGGVLGQAS